MLAGYFPAWTSKRIRRKTDRGIGRTLALSAGVPASIVAAPIVAAAAVAVGVPFLLVVSYGILPAYLVHEKVINKGNRRRKGLVHTLPAKSAAAAAAAALPSS